MGSARYVWIVIGVVALVFWGILIGRGVARDAEQPSDNDRPITNSDPERLLNTMPQWYPDHAFFRSSDYVVAAQYLQDLGKEQAVGKLQDVLIANPHACQVYILCDMLLVARKGRAIEGPDLGAPKYLGGTTHADWPQDPIELVDDVPLLIASAYTAAGSPEAPGAYLRRCLDTCDWNPHRYRSVTPKQLNDALRKLLASPKWKRPLDGSEVEFLGKQVE